LKVLGIVGSRRKGGNTDLLVRKVLEGASAHKIETECIYLNDYEIADCTGCEGCKNTFSCILNDDMQIIYRLLESADALVLGSPTYFYNVTGITKNFFDRLYCYDVFDDSTRSVWVSLNETTGIKYAVTAAVCEQNSEDDMGYTSLTMQRSLEAIGYRVVENIKALNSYAKGDILKFEPELNRALLAGEKLAKTLLLAKSVRERLEK